jgi:hypothetical protein
VAGDVHGLAKTFGGAAEEAALEIFLRGESSGVDQDISWPAPQVGAFVLQSKPALNTGVWQNVAAHVSLVGGQYQVTISPAMGKQFYRLALP